MAGEQLEGAELLAGLSNVPFTRVRGVHPPNVGVQWRVVQHLGKTLLSGARWPVPETRRRSAVRRTGYGEERRKNGWLEVGNRETTAPYPKAPSCAPPRRTTEQRHGFEPSATKEKKAPEDATKEGPEKEGAENTVATKTAWKEKSVGRKGPKPGPRKTPP